MSMAPMATKLVAGSMSERDSGRGKQAASRQNMASILLHLEVPVSAAPLCFKNQENAGGPRSNSVA